LRVSEKVQEPLKDIVLGGNVFDGKGTFFGNLDKLIEKIEEKYKIKATLVNKFFNYAGKN
jgi:hypothetical protein